MYPANKSTTFFPPLSSGLILRSLNLAVGQEVEEIETLVLDGFKWAWLACGLEEP